MDDNLDQWLKDHLPCACGDILNEPTAAEECLDEPWDEILAQQELEDFERTDEYYGYFGDDYGDE